MTIKSLRDLQQEWREHAAAENYSDKKYWARRLRTDWKAEMDCADALEPHILREAQYEALVKAATEALETPGKPELRALREALSSLQPSDSGDT